MKGDFAKKIFIVGLGITGQAMLEYCVAENIPCAGFEEVSEENFKQTKIFVQNKKDYELFYREVPRDFLDQCSLVIVSPGVPLTRWWVQEAAAKKIPVIGELEFASERLEGSIIAVTGTNGKSTTVSLLHEILGRGGKKSSLKGNIGQPLISAVREPPQDCYVVEVSSYQLETICTFKPHIGVLLNITEDHLDRYNGLASYAKAKARLFMNQTKDDYLIYNADDPWCSRLVSQAQSRSYGFSLVNHLQEGAFVHRDEMVVRLQQKEAIYNLSEASLRGLHNQENMLAAILAASLLHIQPANIREALKNFKALPHRLEFVGKFGGIDFYDDSKGTNVGSVVMSLASFDKNVILILGGRDKGGDYGPLRSLIRAKCKALLVYGEAREMIAEVLGDICPTYKVATLKAAVEQIMKIGTAGDIALLSPACSSFDQYKNYHERGNDFRHWAAQIQNC